MPPEHEVRQSSSFARDIGNTQAKSENIELLYADINRALRKSLYGAVWGIFKKSAVTQLPIGCQLGTARIG